MGRLVCTLAVFALTGCATLTGGYTQPEASLADVKVDEVGLRQTKMRLFLRIKNKNGFDIVLSPLETLVWFGNDHPVIQIDRQHYKVLRESETVIEVPIVLNYRRILSAISSFYNTEPFHYQFKGTAHVGVFSKDFDFLGDYPAKGAVPSPNPVPAVPLVLAPSPSPTPAPGPVGAPAVGQ